MLVFLPGQEDIENLQQLLYEQLPSIRSKHHGSIAYADMDPMHGSTEEEDQPSSSSKQPSQPAGGPKEVNIDNLRDFIIRPLYAAMPPEEQLRVFQPARPGIRKFILATNIAETSVTITGVKYGMCKKCMIHHSYL